MKIIRGMTRGSKYALVHLTLSTGIFACSVFSVPHANYWLRIAAMPLIFLYEYGPGEYLLRILFPMLRETGEWGLMLGLGIIIALMFVLNSYICGYSVSGILWMLKASAARAKLA